MKCLVPGDRSFRKLKLNPYYFVSDDGVIVSAKHIRLKILRHNISRCGHHKVFIYEKDISIAMWVHRLVLISFGFNRPSELHQVRHLDGNPHNNRLGNLVWGTHAENMADKVVHGTDPSGERNPRAKISLEQVEFIRNSTEKSRSLADKFGVHRNSIWHIRTHKFWRINN